MLYFWLSLFLWLLWESTGGLLCGTELSLVSTWLPNSDMGVLLETGVRAGQGFLQRHFLEQRTGPVPDTPQVIPDKGGALGGPSSLQHSCLLLSVCCYKLLSGW